MHHSSADLLHLRADRTVGINLVYLVVQNVGLSPVTKPPSWQIVAAATSRHCSYLHQPFLNEWTGSPIISSNKLWRVSASHLPHPNPSYKISNSSFLPWTQSSFYVLVGDAACVRKRIKLLQRLEEAPHFTIRDTNFEFLSIYIQNVLAEHKKAMKSWLEAICKRIFM